MRRVSPVLLVLFSILTFCGTAASAEHFGADRHAAAGVKLYRSRLGRSESH